MQKRQLDPLESFLISTLSSVIKTNRVRFIVIRCVQVSRAWGAITVWLQQHGTRVMKNRQQPFSKQSVVEVLQNQQVLQFQVQVVKE